jgi:micrococcal nuclease
MKRKGQHYLKVLLLAIIMAGCQQHAFKTGQTCKCVGVKDGDTIVVVLDGIQTTIRLAEVDCPEKRQAFGQKAKQFTSDLCFGKTVAVVAKNKDRYGRTVGIVYIDENTILNKELVRAGFAWQYKKYSNDDEYAALESEARAAHKGLGADHDPIAPWEFRKAPKGLQPGHKKREHPAETEELEVES